MTASSFHDGQVLQSLLTVGVNLSAVPDRSQMLNMILTEARKLARAQAGSLYVVEGRCLRFAAAQNDHLAQTQVLDGLLGRQVEMNEESLAGFVAVTGQIMNIPDMYAVGADSRFHPNRQFDRKTGFRTGSVLAIPLKRPDGPCVGVLQLINCLKDGRVVPFSEASDSGILSLASMAAVTIHNVMLQDMLKQSHLDSIIRLSVAAEFRDADTAQHIRRLSAISGLVANAMGMDARAAELIQYASPMHDIGKIGIPDAVLNKAGPLTEQERRTIEKHPSIGAEILGEPQNELMAMAREVALCHHEHFDGNGYPGGLKAGAIPIAARILGIADVFDALMSKRCYKQAFPVERVLEMIRDGRGRQFDGDVSDAFFASIDAVLRSHAAYCQ